MRPIPKGFKALTAVLVCILIFFAAGAGVLLYFQYKNPLTAPPKKAFIILPGIMGSNLLDPDNGNALVWGDTEWLLAKEQQTAGFAKQYLNSIFELDEQNVPVKTLVPDNREDSYGYNDLTKNLSDCLTAEYAQYGYDIITWQYDWRQSNIVLAQKLQAFIDGNAYTDVVLISHGTGGNIAAKYLSDAYNRNKVALFLPFSAPFLGTLSTIDWLFAKNAGLPDMVETQFSQLLTDYNLYNKILDLPILAEILPYPAMGQLSYYDDSQAPILLNGATVTYNEIYDYFCSLDFAQSEFHSLKGAYENLVEYQHKDYLKIGGKYKHITEFVNTVFVVGTGLPTRYTMDINTATGKITSIGSSQDGDGFVWGYSATAGRSLASDKVIIVDIQQNDYITHDNIMSASEVIELVMPSVKKHIKK